MHDVLEALRERHVEIARARDVDLALDQNAARPRRHHEHAVGKEHGFAQVVGHEANGYGAVDKDRLAKAIDQIAITYEFKNGKPSAADAFNSSFLPSAAERKAN